MGWYRRHMAALGIAGGKRGAVTAVQRVSSDLRLNPHFHTLALDGVFVENEAGELAFHPLPALTNADVADILQIARTCIVRLLRRRGVIADDDASDASVVALDAALEDKEPARCAGRIPSSYAARRSSHIRSRRHRPRKRTMATARPARRRRTSRPRTARGIAHGASS